MIGQRKLWGSGDKERTGGALQGVLVWITETRLMCPCMSEQHPPLSLSLYCTQVLGHVASLRGDTVREIFFANRFG